MIDGQAADRNLERLGEKIGPILRRLGPSSLRGSGRRVKLPGPLRMERLQARFDGRGAVRSTIESLIYERSRGATIDARSP
jgi:hypothetical protein